MSQQTPMKRTLAEKTALVTAAGQGIGKATAELFAQEGASVYATDINPQTLAQLEGVHTRLLDVTDRDAIKQAASAIGPVDILFNCAGYVHHGNLLACDRAAWDFSLALNITAMYEMIHAFLPAMLGRRGGCIINMSSVASSIKGVPDRCVYSVTKAGVIGLTKSVAADYVGKGIRCNAICPGTVQTPSLEQRLAAAGDYETARKVFIARQPMSRLGAAQEIAQLALYLASDAAAYVTGQCYVIDGGWSM